MLASKANGSFQMVSIVCLCSLLDMWSVLIADQLFVGGLLNASVLFISNLEIASLHFVLNGGLLERSLVVDRVRSECS
jgi:hypothetical protein